MAELYAIIAVSIAFGVLIAIVAVASVSKVAGAMAGQQALFGQLAVHLKATSALEAKAALEPAAAPTDEDEEDNRHTDPVNRGFKDMVAAGLDPEEPGHVAIWNETRGKGSFYAEPGSID
jgi:hypothetical protein